MTPRIRLSPGRVHQKHHHLQPCSPLCVSLVECHPHQAWVRSRQWPQHQRSPPWGLHTLLQQAKLLRLRKRSQDREWLKTLPSLSTQAFSHSKLIKKRTKTTRRANNHKASELASEARVLLSNFSVIQIVEQLNTGSKKTPQKTTSYVCSSHKDCASLYQEMMHIITKKSFGNHVRIMAACVCECPRKLKDVNETEEMWSVWSSSTVTFQLDIRNFHLPKPRSPMEQIPNQVISTVVSPDSRSRAREGAREGLLALQRLLCGLTFRAGWSMGLGRQCPCSGSSWGEGPGSFPPSLLHHKVRRLTHIPYLKHHACINSKILSPLTLDKALGATFHHQLAACTAIRLYTYAV